MCCFSQTSTVPQLSMTRKGAVGGKGKEGQQRNGVGKTRGKSIARVSADRAEKDTFLALEQDNTQHGIQVRDGDTLRSVHRQGGQAAWKSQHAEDLRSSLAKKCEVLGRKHSLILKCCTFSFRKIPDEVLSAERDRRAAEDSLSGVVLALMTAKLISRGGGLRMPRPVALTASHWTVRT